MNANATIPALIGDCLSPAILPRSIKPSSRGGLALTVGLTFGVLFAIVSIVVFMLGRKHQEAQQQIKKQKDEEHWQERDGHLMVGSEQWRRRQQALEEATVNPNHIPDQFLELYKRNFRILKESEGVDAQLLLSLDLESDLEPDQVLFTDSISMAGDSRTIMKGLLARLRDERDDFIWQQWRLEQQRQRPEVRDQKADPPFHAIGAYEAQDSTRVVSRSDQRTSMDDQQPPLYLEANQQHETGDLLSPIDTKFDIDRNIDAERSGQGMTPVNLDAARNSRETMITIDTHMAVPSDFHAARTTFAPSETPSYETRLSTDPFRAEAEANWAARRRQADSLLQRRQAVAEDVELEDNTGHYPREQQPSARRRGESEDNDRERGQNLEGERRFLSR